MPPRDGSNIYSQPDPDVVADTTIESAKYNNFTNDVAQDLNLPRPIVAGGTGAINAADALTNLGAEKSKQGPVTNYDSFPFVNGSFYSDADATAAPSVDAYIGIYYEHSNTQYASIEARRIGGDQLYVRRKNAGVWGAWVDSNAVMDAAKVNRAYDTMTGDLTITKSAPFIYLNKTASGQETGIKGQLNNVQRWLFRLGNQAAESGTQVGNDLDIHSYKNDGSYIRQNLNINRDTGQWEIGGSLSAAGNVWSHLTGTTGAYHFGGSGTKYFSYDGANYTLEGGQLTVNAGIISNTGLNTGIYYLGLSGTYKLQFDGTRYLMLGAPVGIGFPAVGTDAARVDWAQANFQPLLGFTAVRQGGGPGQFTNIVNIGWDNAGTLFSVDGIAQGAFATQAYATGQAAARVLNSRLTLVGDLSLGQASADPNPGAVVVSIRTTSQQRLRWMQHTYDGTNYVTIGTSG